MMLTERQVQALLAIIDKHHSAFIANFVSPTALPPETLAQLQRVGIVQPQVQGVRDAFLYGMLAANLPPKKGPGSRQTYAKLSARLRQSPFPLSEIERGAISAAQQNAGQYISGLGARVKGVVSEQVMQVDARLRAADRQAYRKTIAQAIEGRKQLKSVVSDLGHATGDWARNLERVANTELAAALSSGTAQAVGRGYGPDARVAKQSSPYCCDTCARLLNEPGTRVPKIFSLAELEANGTNVGKKVAAWKPVVGPIHPNCFPPGEPVTTGRGDVRIETVRVGDWVLTHRGRWRQVMRTWTSWYEGQLRCLWSEGSREQLTCTPGHKLAVGRDVWWPARDVDLGGYLVSLLTLTASPPQRQHLSPLVYAERWVGTGGEPEIVIRTPWGTFSGMVDTEPDSAPGDVLTALEGCWRMGEWHITRLAQQAPRAQAGGGGRASVQARPRCFPGQLTRRHREAQQARPRLSSPGGAARSLLARQALHCERKGDRLRFGVPAIRPRQDVRPVARERPRRVFATASRRYAGTVYNLSVDEDESYLVRGLVVSNCGCVLVHVPEGLAFNAEGTMVPESLIDKPKA